MHLVVEAESELGKRLHIDKAMLQDWREHLAQLMREQGIAANATRRVVRGQHKRTNTDRMLRAKRYGKPNVMRERVKSVAKDYHAGASFHDPARDKLVATRKDIVAQWMTVADTLDTQGQRSLANSVRLFFETQNTGSD